MKFTFISLVLLPFYTTAFNFQCFEEDLGGRGGVCPKFVRDRMCTKDTTIAPASPTTLHFGVIGPMSVTDASWLTRVQFGMLCGIQHVLDHPTMLSGVNIDWTYADSKTTQNGGFEAGLCLQQAGINLVYGPYYSSASTGAATVAKVFDMVLTSPSASSPTLANKEDFPTYSRVFPSDHFQGTGLAYLTKYFGWRYVATLHNRGDLYTEGIVQAYVGQAGKLGITIKGGASFLEETEEAYREALLILKNSGARVILLSIFDRNAPLVLEVAHSLGMVGKGWVYLATESWILETPLYEDNIGVGILGLSPQMDTTSPAYGELRDCVANHWNDTDGMFGNYSWVNGILGSYEPFAYDNVLTILHAANTIGPENIQNSEMLLNAVRNTEFLGATGYVKLDNVTGERLGLNYGIYNRQPGRVANVVGQLSTVDFSISKAAAYDALVFDAAGSTEIPLDLDVDCSADQDLYYNKTVAATCNAAVRRVIIERTSEFAVRYCPQVEAYDIPCDYPSFGDNKSIFSFFMLGTTLAFELGCLGYMLRHFGHPYIRRGQRVFLVVVVLGCILAKVPFFVEMNCPPTDIICTLKPFCVSVGGTFVFGTFLVKSWRVSVIFLSKTLKKIRISDGQLMLRLLAVVLLVVVINALMIWQTPVTVVTVDTQNIRGEFGFNRVCRSPSSQISNVLLFFLVILMFASCYISFKLRKVQSDISETKSVFLATYNCTIFAMAAVALIFGVPLTPTTEYLVGVLCTCFSCLGIVGFMLIPRFSLIFHNVKVSKVQMSDSLHTGTGQGSMKVQGAPGQTQTVTTAVTNVTEY